MIAAENVYIHLSIKRKESLIVNATETLMFSYENPTIDSVHPRYGPSSGGTVVTLRGSSLDISGRNATEITLAGQKCEIRSASLYKYVLTYIFVLFSQRCIFVCTQV